MTRRQFRALSRITFALLALALLESLVFCIVTAQKRPQEEQAEAAKAVQTVVREGTETRFEPLVYKTTDEETKTEPELAGEQEVGPCGAGGYECVDKDDVERLACVIYQEGGGDDVCDMCRRRIADIVLHRVKDSRYPDTIRGVLMDDNPAPQWGLFSVTGIIWSERAGMPSEEAAVNRAYDIARDVLEGHHSDLTEDYIFCAEFPQGEDVIECCGIYYGK